MSTKPEKIFKSSLSLMEVLEKWGYISAGVSFLLLGMILFVSGWIHFFFNFQKGVLHATMALMVDLLLVIIFLELFRTILEFLKTHSLSLEPFLHIGIVAGIRHILTLTATSHETMISSTPSQFNQYLWDVSLHGILVLGLVVADFLYRKGHPEEHGLRTL